MDDILDDILSASGLAEKKTTSPISAPANENLSLDFFRQKAAKYGLRVNSDYRPNAKTKAGKPSFHGIKAALDLGGTPEQMMRFAQDMERDYGQNLDELIYTPLGRSVKNGKKSNPLDAKNHNGHVHLAFTGRLAGRRNDSEAPLSNDELIDGIIQRSGLAPDSKNFQASTNPVVPADDSDVVDDVLSKSGLSLPKPSPTVPATQTVSSISETQTLENHPQPAYDLQPDNYRVVQEIPKSTERGLVGIGGASVIDPPLVLTGANGEKFAQKGDALPSGEIPVRDMSSDKNPILYGNKTLDKDGKETWTLRDPKAQNEAPASNPAKEPKFSVNVENSLINTQAEIPNSDPQLKSPTQFQSGNYDALQKETLGTNVTKKIYKQKPSVPQVFEDSMVNVYGKNILPVMKLYKDATGTDLLEVIDPNAVQKDIDAHWNQKTGEYDNVGGQIYVKAKDLVDAFEQGGESALKEKIAKQQSHIAKPVPTPEEARQMLADSEEQRLEAESKKRLPDDEDRKSAIELGGWLNTSGEEGGVWGNAKAGAANLAAGALGGTGRFGDFFAGVTRPLQSIGIDYPYKAFSELGETGKIINAEAMRGKGAAAETANIAGGALYDIPRLIALSRIGGGNIVAFAADSGLQSAGRGESQGEIAKETAKGAALG